MKQPECSRTCHPWHTNLNAQWTPENEDTQIFNPKGYNVISGWPI